MKPPRPSSAFKTGAADSKPSGCKWLTETIESHWRMRSRKTLQNDPAFRAVVEPWSTMPAPVLARLDHRKTPPIIPIMRFVLTVAAIWATSVAPQLCRIGALTACCADVPHRQPAPERAKACVSGGCGHECQEPGEEPVTPRDRNCGTCENFCGAVVKPANAVEHTRQSPAKPPAVLPGALGGDNRFTNDPTHHPLLSTADFPRLPRPSSDFPLLL